MGGGANVGGQGVGAGVDPDKSRAQMGSKGWGQMGARVWVRWGGGSLSGTPYPIWHPTRFWYPSPYLVLHPL